MRNSLVYLEGEFYELNQRGLPSNNITFENLHYFGNNLDIYIDESSLTTDFISDLNLVQLRTGILYSLYSIDEINSRKDDRVIDESSKIGVFLRKKNQTVNGNEQVTYFSRKETTIDNIKDILSNNNSVLSCMLDGSNWRIHLSDGMILGKMKSVSIESKFKYPYHVQACIDSDEDNILYGDDFNITHIFLNSCSDSLVDKTLYGNNLNVVQNFLKNTPSVISSYRMKHGDERENLLHTLLLTNGYTISEIHYILNVNATLQQNEISPYINFGSAINKLNHPQNEYLCSTLLIGENIWRVNFTDSRISSYFECNLTLSNQKIKDLLSQKSYLNTDINNEEIYFTYIPNIRTNKVKCIWFSYNNFNFSSVKISLTENQSNQSIEKYLLDVTNNIQKFNTIGLNSNKLKNRIDDFSRVVTSKLTQSLSYQINEVMLNDFRNSEELLYKSIEPLVRQTMMADYPVEHFHNKSIISSLSMDAVQECPNCGCRIFVKVSRVPISSSVRYSGICRICHNTFDMTDLSKKDSLIKCHCFGKQESQVLNIELKNLNEYTSSSYYVFFIPSTDYSSNIDDIEINHILNDEGYYVLNKGESLQFQIEFKRIRTESEVEKFIDYNIYIIENGELQYYSTKVFFPSRVQIPRYEELKKSILDYLYKYLPEKRVVHSLSVAKNAVDLANYYGENIYEAEIAALLHDSAKGFEKNIAFEEFLNSKGILTEINGKKLPHAHVGKKIAEKIFNIDNTQILSAIYWHTTGRKNMTPLEKIIFVADYTSEDRNFDNLSEVKEISKIDLGFAVGKIMDYYINYLCIVNDLTPNIVELECRDYYISGE